MAELVELAAGFSLSDLYPSVEVLKHVSGMRIKLEKLHQASDRILENMVDEHKEKINKIQEAGNKQVQGVEADVVDVLLELQQQGDFEFLLTNDAMKAIIQDMFGAGSETSATALEWVMSEIVKNPELMRKAQNEPKRNTEATPSCTSSDSKRM
ncbi:hypothetical protein PTKIN_Ptkin11bG0194200 [Pterospermum kingtungense]